MAIITLNNNSLSSVTALPAGVGGKVLQVVSSYGGDYNQSNTSTTYTDVTKNSSAWETALTPSSSSNKIFVIIQMNCGNSGTDAQARTTINVVGKIGSGSYTELSNNGFHGLYSGSDEPDMHFAVPMSFIWSPSTTSECKIKVQFKNSYTSSNMTSYINPNSSNHSSVTLMEVVG